MHTAIHKLSLFFLAIILSCAYAMFRHWKVEKDKESKANYKRWDQDYDLLEFGQLEFFREYLELGRHALGLLG